MFLLHGGQVTGPYERDRLDASVAARSIPADAMCGPTPQGPWSPVYPVATPANHVQGPLKWAVYAAFGVTFAVLAGAGVAVVVRGAGSTSPAPVATSEYRAPAAPAPRVLTPIEQLAAKTTLAEAIAFTRPHMADSVDEIDQGTAMLAVWSTTRMKWSDVSAIQPETSVPRAMKDSDLERGKRICASGSIIEIAAEKASESRLYNGAIGIDAGLIRFVAVGDTGALVAHSSARFCGIVTGRFDYHNSIGGMAHAVRVVGMFDLPENRKVTK